jgi:hypothetical protein
MSKATDTQLGNLHAAVAEVLVETLRNGAVVGSEEGEPVRITAPAAYIGAAIAFLKNNNITADPSTNEGLKNLDDQLRARRNRLTPEDLAKAADDFAASQGSFVQ